MWKAHMLASLAILLAATSAGAASGCGSRGGPGYRGPNGKCVGWDQLARVCGSPPSERCTPEGVDSLADGHSLQQQRLIDERNQRKRPQASGSSRMP